MKKRISVILPCYNESENIKELYERLTTALEKVDYPYELIFIDNCSTDNTVETIKTYADIDKKVKIIANARNFGSVRSGYYGLLQCKGDICISLATDLQDPPEIILDFIKKWEEGYKIVLGVKSSSEEHPILYKLRGLYYSTISKISETPLIRHCTGSGLYDQEVVEILRKIDDPYPYFRGLISEIGFPIAQVEFRQPNRKAGVSKTNFYALYDLAMLGLTNHTKVPLRLMTMSGFVLALISFFIATVFLVRKLLYWDTFQLGLAPLLIGLFFFVGIQMLFIGLLGEYVGAIYTHVRKLPLVIESERTNFD